MSSLIRTSQANVTYPSCSFCGGCAINPKSSPKRKVALCQISLYTSVSDSFITWYKKQEEPKGMLWLHSCCVRRGQDSNVELISRGCRGRCSYTLKFGTPSATEEWYRLLKQESRKSPSFGEELSSDSCNKGSIGDHTSLDSMLTDISPLSSITELSAYSESDENSDSGSVVLTSPITPDTSSKSKKKKSRVKVKSVFGNPLHSLGRNSKKSLNNSVSTSTMQGSPLESISNTRAPSQSTPDLMDPWVRWSWPLKT